MPGWTGVGFAHALHSPYWGVRALLGLDDETPGPTRALRRFLIHAAVSRVWTRVEHGLELLLLLRGDQHANRLVRPLVEGGEPHHHPHLLGIQELDLLDDGRERGAGLAGRIEELDDGDGRLSRSDHW